METASSPPLRPTTEYARRLAERGAALARLERRGRWLAHLRLAVFLLGALMVLAFWAAEGSVLFLLLPVVALFVVLVILHVVTDEKIEHLRRVAGFYEHGLARLEDRWRGGGTSGARYRDAGHLYAEDLDLFAPGGLFELLCTARTRLGEEALAAWLKAPAAPEEVRRRQEAVRELQPLLDLRERLAGHGGELREKLDPQVILAWGARPPALTSRWPQVAAVALALLFLLAVAGAVLGRAHWSVPLIVFLFEMAFLSFIGRRTRPAVLAAEEMEAHLNLLGEIADDIESLHPHGSKLRAVHAELQSGPAPLSAAMRRLRRIVHWHDSLTRNQVLLPVAVGFLVPVHLAYAMESWRRAVQPRLARWLEAVGEFEALLALANFAYENPAYPLPEILEGAPAFEGKDLAHPLLPLAARKGNDLRLDGAARLLVITGSNMSGKSTMLRTVGLNAVLALAGAPVCAARLRLSPLALGASINIHDSLLEGKSHFYAEMERLRDITGLLDGRLPLCFLLDELMHGTNSHDRRIGAEAILRKLVDGGAVGLVTTHDLSLAELAEGLDGRAGNAHFEYQLIDGRMVFDYRMRAGVVTRGNALEVMRSLGIKV